MTLSEMILLIFLKLFLELALAAFSESSCSLHVTTLALRLLDNLVLPKDHKAASRRSTRVMRQRAS